MVDFGRLIYQSPVARTAIPVFSSVLIGLFTGFLVVEMTKGDVVDWGSFYEQFSFYCLLLFSWVTYRFHKMLFDMDTEVERFKDAEYCTAFARSQLLPSHLDAAKTAIKDGDKKRFEDAMKQVKKVL